MLDDSKHVPPDEATPATPHDLFFSVVVPAYNEEDFIERTVSELQAHLERAVARYEIVVVDDGSSDATCSVVRGLSEKDPRVRLLEQGTNQGKGAAVTRGMLEAAGDAILFMDADLPYELEALERVAELFADKGADLVIGARDLPGSSAVEDYTLLRKLSSRVFSMLVNALAVRGIPDTQCGFKGFTREATQDIFPRLTIRGFGFDPEILHIAQHRGYRIVRIPVTLRHRAGSKVRIIADTVRMTRDLLKIRIHSWRRQYD